MSETRQPPPDPEPLKLRDDRAANRYEATLGDAADPAAILEYRLLEASITLLHTEVSEGFEGQGIGSRLARAVFEDVRARGLTAIPKCSFIVRWLERHPEQHDLLARPLDARPPAADDRHLA